MSLSDPHVEPMYCPSCDQMVPENWDRTDEDFRCAECHSSLYEDKEEYIQVVHATARWEKEHGWGPWYDDDADIDRVEEGEK